MGIDIQRTKDIDKLRNQELEEYFTYSAKIKNGKDIINIIDKTINQNLYKEQNNGNKGTED